MNMRKVCVRVLTILMVLSSLHITAFGEAAAPLTGDHTPIGIYAALLITAIVAVIALLVYKRKK